MNATVRRLGPADVRAMRDLNRLFGRAFDDAETYGARPPDDAYLQELLAAEHIVVLVAEDAGVVQGGLVAYELDKFESRRKEVYIYDLAVESAHRRKGLATALIDALARHARERGAWTIFVQADHGDDPAISLYARLGRREDVLHFDLLLG